MMKTYIQKKQYEFWMNILEKFRDYQSTFVNMWCEDKHTCIHTHAHTPPYLLYVNTPQE